MTVNMVFFISDENGGLLADFGDDYKGWDLYKKYFLLL